MNKGEIIKAAEDYVWTDFEKFVRMLAKEHTVANMGFDLGEAFQGYGSRNIPPDLVVEMAYNTLYQGSESDEMAEGIEEEYRSWLKDARRDAEKVRKAGLPLTLANASLAFELKGPFAKRPRKTSKK